MYPSKMDASIGQRAIAHLEARLAEEKPGVRRYAFTSCSRDRDNPDLVKMGFRLEPIDGRSIHLYDAVNMKAPPECFYLAPGRKGTWSDAFEQGMLDHSYTLRLDYYGPLSIRDPPLREPAELLGLDIPFKRGRTIRFHISSLLKRISENSYKEALHAAKSSGAPHAFPVVFLDRMASLYLKGF